MNYSKIKIYANRNASGLRLIAGTPWLLAGIVIAGAAVGLAERTGVVGALSVATLRDPSTWPRSLLLWTLGQGFAELLEAIALTACLASVVGRERTTSLLRAAATRGPAVLSLWVVERLLYMTLAIAVAAPGLSLYQRQVTPLIGAGTISIASALPLLVLLFALPAFRIATVETACGRPSYLALAHGLSIGFRNLRPLLGLLAGVVLLSSPLWGMAALLMRVPFDESRAWIQILAAAARGALVFTVEAWAYVALGLWLNRPTPTATPRAVLNPTTEMGSA